jgi:hypothetical protein
MKNEVEEETPKNENSSHFHELEEATNLLWTETKGSLATLDLTNCFSNYLVLIDGVILTRVNDE